MFQALVLHPLDLIRALLPKITCECLECRAVSLLALWLPLLRSYDANVEAPGHVLGNDSSWACRARCCFTSEACPQNPRASDM